MIAARTKAYLHLICPWIIKANSASSNPIVLPQLPFGTSSTSTAAINLAPWIDGSTSTNGGPQWEEWWDALDENDILKYAPFKLMAIVNRLDIRGNSAYGRIKEGFMRNGGETRFIFTLINPTTGKPPAHDNIFFGGGPNNGGIDWVGMNVILEYGNPFHSTCAIKDFAQQWYDLSAFPLGTGGVPNTAYNDHLEAITNQVTRKNASPNKNKSWSAINQIRTNEKILFALDGFSNGTGFWAPPNWQLRQFQLINQDGYLHPSVVTNTPNDYNAISMFYWIYGTAGNSSNINRVFLGNHSINEPYLDGAAEITNEMTHYIQPEWNDLLYIFNSNNMVYNTNSNIDLPDETAKTVRHQLSLNTCQGCHAGETKTNFTMVMPRGYGEEANYWDAIPSYQEYGVWGTSTPPVLDYRFNNENANLGTTFEKSNATHVENHDMVEKTSNTTNQIVSPFLTGRRYSSVTSNHWQDDELDDVGAGEGNVGVQSDLLSDEKLRGLYYVNDPSNESASMPAAALVQGTMYGKGGNFPQIHTKRWGFNDLQRRQDDLCSFLQTVACSGNTTPLFSLMKSISFIPLPLGSH